MGSLAPLVIPPWTPPGLWAMSGMESEANFADIPIVDSRRLGKHVIRVVIGGEDEEAF
jgi:hypothetical protein